MGAFRLRSYSSFVLIVKSLMAINVQLIQDRLVRLTAVPHAERVQTPPPEAVPNRLYKFRSLTSEQDVEFTKDIVVGSRLYFADAASFNDPFDTVPNVTLTGSSVALRRAYKRTIGVAMDGAPRAEKRRALAAFQKIPLATIQEELRRSANRRSLKFGLCSLCERWDHVLMWSHYAANHTGVCLGFSTTPGGYFTYAQAVNYAPERPSVDWTSPDKDQALFRALLTKAEFWSYEREWRVFELEKGTGAFAFPPAKLELVIFGAKIAPERKRLVQSWLGARGTTVRTVQAVVSDTRFELDFVEA